MLFLLIASSCGHSESKKLKSEENTTQSYSRLDTILQTFKKGYIRKETSDTTKIKNRKSDFNISAIKLNNKAMELYSFVRSEPISYPDSLHLNSALTLLNKAIKLDTQYYLAYANKALILSKLKRYQEAMETLDKIIKIRPNYAEGISGQGFLYEKTGESIKAVERYQEAIAAYLRRLNEPLKLTNRVNVQVDIAFMLVFTNGKEAAMRLMDTIIVYNPNNKVANYMKKYITSFDRREFIDNY